MKAIRCDLPDEEVIEILPLSDLHLGDSNADYKLIMERIEHIKNTRNCYCILGGDLMDTAIASSVGDTYGANLQPMEQLKQCVKIFDPIKEKILAVFPGNHENRVYKSDGLDMTELMCAQLGIPEKYSPTTVLLFVRFGRDVNRHNRPQLYTIYATHGSGGGRKEGGKINRLADLATIVDSDIYICRPYSPAGRAPQYILPRKWKQFFRCSGREAICKHRRSFELRRLWGRARIQTQLEKHTDNFPEWAKA